MLPLRVLAVGSEHRDVRLSDAVFMVASALDSHRPDCALPLRIRVHGGRGAARSTIVDGELWIDVSAPTNADPLAMVVLEEIWRGLREAQARHPEARIAFPTARARLLLASIEERMDRSEQGRDPLTAQADPGHAMILRVPPVTAPAMTAVFEVAGPGMPSFRVTRRRRRTPDRG